MNNSDVQLLFIEHEDFSLYIKGRPFNRRFESLKQLKQKINLNDQTMNLTIEGVSENHAYVFHPIKEELIPVSEGNLPPIFFENEIYQIVITPKNGNKITFYHEHPQIRNAVTQVGTGDTQLLMGQLQFMNEVGLTTFEIHGENGMVVSVTIELFPTKLDYKEDYQRLLHEVSEEVYNLVFHFMNRTFIGTSKIHTNKPSLVEFYQLLQHYFNQFLQAIHQIERQPHHQLETHYRKVRGDQLRRANHVTRSYLRKRPHLLKEVSNGIKLNNTSLMPEVGYNEIKELSYNTLENQFVKFMIQRLIQKIEHLRKRVYKYERNSSDYEFQISIKLQQQKSKLEAIIQKPFWKKIDQLQQSILSLVMQLKPGYRDAYIIYLILSQGLNLQDQIVKMSVKDVATLYEYWTYLKMGQILHNKYIPVSQDILKVKRNGLFIDLDQSKKATRTFIHPQTNEKITLSFQERHVSPTAVQKPDIMLTIEKKDHSYTYNYIFDAKYRIDYGPNGSLSVPGPLDEDINTMHRYRDAWVVENDGPYERYAFGAYVLFPWSDEDSYEIDHRYYKSIDKVNIGGFPFLPNSTRLVEQFLEHLIESSPETLQEQGILPKGSIEYWESSLETKVLVGLVGDSNSFRNYMRNREYHLPTSYLKKGWQDAVYVALYIPSVVAKEAMIEHGIKLYGKINNVKFDRNNGKEYVAFSVEKWQTLTETIRPVGYGVQRYILTTINMLKYARELPELYIKSKEELKIWRMLRRLSAHIKVGLDNKMMDRAQSVERFYLGNMELLINDEDGEIALFHQEREKTLPLDWLHRKPTKVFREICNFLSDVK